jgi:hypothetical protein
MGSSRASEAEVKNPDDVAFGRRVIRARCRRTCRRRHRGTGEVAAHFVDTGTHLGTFLDVPATGRAVTTQELAVDLVADGRIAAG